MKLVLIGVLAYIFIGNANIDYRFIVGGAVLVAAGLLFLLYQHQEKLLYQPNVYPKWQQPHMNPQGFRSPAEHGIPFDNIYLTTPDGLKLHAWFLHTSNDEQTKSRPTVVFFHENAGNMGFRLPDLSTMYRRLGVNIFVLSYRGYGESEGTPTEAGLKIDAETAFRHVLSRPDVDPSKVLVLGRSLGGAVATYIASRFNDEICGTILENTFYSVADMADVMFPVLKPLRKWILRMDWHSAKLVASVTHPILFLSAQKDDIVPPIQMARLYEAATGSADKQIIKFAQSSHHDTWTAENYYHFIAEFVHKCVPGYVIHENAKTPVDPNVLRQLGLGASQ